MWAAFIVLASFGASDNIYVYPEGYEHGDGLGATVDEEALAKLIEDNTVEGEGDTGIPNVRHKIDLNNDGTAEILLAPSQVESYHADWFDIFALRDGRYEEIGSCANWFSLRKSKNGYARILSQDNVGERTNPTWTTSITTYDGIRYVTEHKSELTSGQMEAKGLEAYRAKDYAAAEIWFLNLIRSGLGNPVHAENNLALVLLRTNRYQEVIDRLTAIIERLEAFEKAHEGQSISIALTPEQRANAQYNMGKAHEGLSDLSAAWRHYYEACKLVPTDERMETLKRLAKLEVDTTGYEVIW